MGALPEHHRHAEKLAAVHRAVFEGEGSTDPATRAAAATGIDAPPQLASYLAAVRNASYRITDADVTALLDAGWTEEQLFEVTVAAALGRAQRSLDAGLRALGIES
jgi:alkylhydroperoxidase family enzyme